ncbi:Putative uncharacterized protein [Thermobacillus xylanilyticus]|uniref:Uncharacterized protein n=1 Tax=Thermobacillus xylanilyticus TaxID=76633 RepID=A0ABM8V9C8_THEXY|nr:hypothetical protein [Thermobacillus xylanilyticus]CAG5092912.1 Putative uncharacterized protein [Thermobacillus xylanilyticus]
MSQARVKISQQHALLIESLRGRDWTDDELLGISGRGGLPKDDSVFAFDYEELREFAVREPELYASAVREGYRMKFNTLGGLRCWLYLAFGGEPHIDRRPGLEGISAILTDGQLAKLEEALAYGWQVQQVGESLDSGKATYRIEPAVR